MKNTITTKTFIRALLIFALVIWAVTYLYLISCKSSLLLYYQSRNLYEKEEKLVEEFNEIARLNPHSLPLILICEHLCQIKVCEKDFSSGKSYLAQLFIIADSVFNDSDKSNLYLFAGNIYRDFGQFYQAQRYYQKSLCRPDELLAANTGSVSIASQNTGINKAKVLNNLGVLYFLFGKKGANREERWKNYSLAKNYLEQAIKLLSVLPANETMCLRKTIDTNIEQCLVELKFLD